MIRQVTWEWQTFLICIFLGMCATSCYDVLRILRVMIPHHKFVIALEDILYWIGIGIGVSYFIFQYNGGVIRSFFIEGFIIGMVFMNISISKITISLFLKIYNWVKDRVRRSFARKKDG